MPPILDLALSNDSNAAGEVTNTRLILSFPVDALKSDSAKTMVHQFAWQ
jgi:hypothetical protein